MGGVTSGRIFDIYTTDFAVEPLKVEERGDFTLFTLFYLCLRCHSSESMAMCYYVLARFTDTAKITAPIHSEHLKSDANWC